MVNKCVLDVDCYSRETVPATVLGVVIVDSIDRILGQANGVRVDFIIIDASAVDAQDARLGADLVLIEFKGLLFSIAIAILANKASLNLVGIAQGIVEDAIVLGVFGTLIITLK